MYRGHSEDEEEEYEEGDEGQLPIDGLPVGETQVDIATEEGKQDEEEEEEEEEMMDPCGAEEEEAEEIVEQKKKATSYQDHVISDDPEVDFETLVREEFKKLNREYRLMEDARHAIAGASGKLGKQGKLLEFLKDEKENLLTDLKNAKCRAYKMRDKQSINTILEALERYEKYKADITACLLSIAEMESNVDKIMQKLVEQRLKVQALYGQSLTTSQAEHRKRILENKLYHVTTQTDTLVTRNKFLKAEINMMLKLRGAFYRRMLHIKKISGKIKQRMGEVVYEATTAYDQRDDSINKINILRERNDKDSKQHVLEIKEFQRVLHHDSKIHEFLAIKNKARELLENTAQRIDRKNKVKIAELNELLLAYKKSFRAILMMANTNSIDVLVTTYLEEEHKNYAMFVYITDLNHETNSLQDAIELTKKEIEMLSQQRKETKASRETTLEEYDDNLAEATARLDGVVKESEEIDQTLEESGKLLEEAFDIAGCSNAPVIALLGNQKGMGNHNIALCLKALEHRITELLFEKGQLEVRKSVEIDGNQLPKKTQLWTQGQKPAPQGGPFKPVVHVTGRVDSSEQDDEESEIKAWSERPLYFDEMKEIIQESLLMMKDPEAANEGRRLSRKSLRFGIAAADAIPSVSKTTTASVSKLPSTSPSKAAEAEPAAEPEPPAQPEPTPEPEPEPPQEEQQQQPEEPEQQEPPPED